jgi:hypothetical protein
MALNLLAVRWHQSDVCRQRQGQFRFRHQQRKTKMKTMMIEARYTEICNALRLVGLLSADANDVRAINDVGDMLKARIAEGLIEKPERGLYQMRIVAQEKNPKRIEAGRKAATTKRAKQVRNDDYVARGHKAWATRRAHAAESQI